MRSEEVDIVPSQRSVVSSAAASIACRPYNGQESVVKSQWSKVSGQKSAISSQWKKKEVTTDKK
ncbi:MAG: hypothetical protein AB1861_20150 [Cyanobacteriota bacterium]